MQESNNQRPTFVLYSELVPVDGIFVLDAKNPEAADIRRSLQLPVVREDGSAFIPRYVKLLNLNYLDAELVELLARLSTFGTDIVIENKRFPTVNARPFLRYKARVIHEDEPRYFPKQLKALLERDRGAHRFEDVLNVYNQAIRNRVFKNHNRDFEGESLAIKKFLYASPITVRTTNWRAILEYDAEREFVKDLRPAKQKLTEDQKAELLRDARYYGIDIPYTGYKFHAVLTRQGYAIIPQFLYDISESDASESMYNRLRARTTGCLPQSIRMDCRVHEADNDTILCEMYTYLQELKARGDEFLALGYKRCPVCGTIYSEMLGCAGHVPGLVEQDDETEDRIRIKAPKHYAPKWSQVRIPESDNHLPFIDWILRTDLKPEYYGTTKVGASCTKCSCDDCTGCTLAKKKAKVTVR